MKGDLSTMQARREESESERETTQHNTMQDYIFLQVIIFVISIVHTPLARTLCVVEKS
jgi:hypothetical protein